MSLMFVCKYCFLIGLTSYFVKKSELGTAIAIAGTAMWTCQCLGPLMNSFILNQRPTLRDSYTLLSLVGACIGFIPVMFSVWMLRS